MEPPDVPAHASRVPVTRFNLVLASPEKNKTLIITSHFHDLTSQGIQTMNKLHSCNKLNLIFYFYLSHYNHISG
jgi:hypothetical protein